MYLPNEWYITPNNYLYNTMGKYGHKSANLIYQLYYSIFRDDDVCNPKDSLEKAKKILEQGYVDKFLFDEYTNLKYDFISVYPDDYYDLDNMSKIRYDSCYKKTYNPTIVKLISGILSAQSGLYSFFYNLKNDSDHYYEDLEFIKKMNLDDILVRCCGFHKISSVCEKTITTSCVNYEEEFEEYIDRGWNIDFIKPILLSTYSKKLEEYPDSYLLIKRMYKNK